MNNRSETWTSEMTCIIGVKGTIEGLFVGGELKKFARLGICQGSIPKSWTGGLTHCEVATRKTKNEER